MSSIKEATIRVLAPEEDIDHFYLGETQDISLKGLQEVSSSARPEAERSKGPGPAPSNISAGDFRRLQSGMLSNGLAFAAKDRSYGAELTKKNKDSEGIWISPKAKKHKFFQSYEKEFLDQPQPLRTDLEFELSGKGFVEVEIPPGT